MPARTDKYYHACDLLSDILSNGKSARLYNSLVKEQKLFTEINAYIMGDIEPGMFVIQGKLSDGVDVKDANKAIENELEKVANEKIEEKELQKVKNKVESTLTFSEMSILNKAMNLAYYELLGNADLINSEINRYAEVSSADIQKMANEILVKNNCSTLYYLAKK
jgi:predicted Zn-dependent peptidase